MRATRALADKFSISLSMICAIHCLTVPLLLVLLPSLAAMQLDHESFHFWMVVAVIPTSLYALTLGCKQHQRKRVLALGGIGLILLLFAVALGADRIGETGEKLLTLLGALCVATGHLMNYRLCRKPASDHCPCPTREAQKA